MIIVKNIININAAKTAQIVALLLVLSSALLAQSTSNSKEPTASAAPTGSTQTVNAQQSGEWTLGIDPAKNTVQLANSEANPLPVKIAPSGPARKPFQRRVIVTVPAGYGVGHTNMVIPSGKRLVIENLSSVARVPQGLWPYVQVLTFFDSGDTVLDAQDIAYHRMAFVEQGSLNGQTTSTANHKVLVFADEHVATNYNLGVTISFGISGTVTQATYAEVTLSGYIEDAPTP